MLIKLQRQTNSGVFLPEIDGLRFFAILPVILDHAYWVFSTNVGAAGVSLEGLAGRLFSSGELGVQLFFAISGYILGMGFYRAAKRADGVHIGDYFKKRLYRLEPPFIVVMLGFFVLLLLQGRFTFLDGVPHLFASLAYVHGLIYQQGSIINTVTWSLEIELQFYLMAPFLYFVYRMRVLHAVLLFLTLIIGFILGANLMGDFHWSILSHGHFFLVGAIMHLLRVEPARRFIWSQFGGALFIGVLLFFFCIEANYGAILGNIVKVLNLAVLFWMVLSYPSVKSLLSHRALFLTGGMCYSIYLLHYPLLAFFSKIWAQTGGAESFMIFLPLAVIVVLAVSIVFFVLVERPFMHFSRGASIRPAKSLCTG